MQVAVLGEVVDGPAVPEMHVRDDAQPFECVESAVDQRQVHILSGWRDCRCAARSSAVTSLLASTMARTRARRALETLTEHGVVSHTHLLAGTKTYQLVSHADHAHLVCRDCGAVAELERAIAARFTAEVSGTHSFTVDFGHLSVFGRCADCAPEPAQEAG